MLKPKFLRVIDTLLKGQKIDLKGYTVVFSEDNKLCIIATKIDGETKKTEEILLGLDISFNVFVDWCEELEEQEIPLSIPKIKS